MIFHNILIKKKGLKRALETFNLSEYQPDNFLLSKGWQFTQQVKEENAKFIPCPTFKIPYKMYIKMVALSEVAPHGMYILCLTSAYFYHIKVS